MIVTGIALENIKSYAGRQFARLELGINSLRGENGAGKSTILEGIGAVLFNHLPYKPASDMVRRGCVWGTVSVDVVSELDGKEYQVIRRLGSNPDYFVYDPVAGVKVAAGTNGVVEWLRRQFELRAEDDLAGIFQDIVGPAQGTFTAPFLLPPGHLAAKFDPLLHVEEYRATWDRMLEVVRFYDTQATEAATRKAAAEAVAAGLPAAEAELSTWRSEQQRLEASLASSRAAREEVAAELGELERRREERDRQESECGRRREWVAVLEQRQRDAQQRCEEAATAVEVVKETQSGFEAYRAAEKRRDALEARRREREEWRRLQNEHASALEVARNDLKHLSDRLETVAAAEQHVVELLPLVQEQAEAEEELRRQQQRENELERAQREIPEVEERLAQVRKRISGVEEEMAGAEALRSLAEQLPARKSELDRWQRAVEELKEQAAELKGLREAEGDASRRLESLRARRDTLRAEAARLESLRPLADTLSERESSLQAAREQYAQTKADLGQAEKALAQVQGGLCPFLEEPCRNLHEGQDLTTYFEGRVKAARQRLEALKREDYERKAAVEEARQAADAVSRLPGIEDQLEQVERAIGDEEKTLARSQRRIGELGDVEAKLENAQVERQRAEATVREAQAAADKLAALAGLRESYATLQDQAARLVDDLERLQELVRRNAEAPKAREEAEQRLARLGDPRSQMLVAQREAEQRSTLERQIGAKKADIARLAVELADVERRLAEYAGLDEALEEQARLLKLNKAAHDRYLAHLNLAQDLPRREEARRAAERDLAMESMALAEAEKQLDELRAAFDEGRYRQADAQLRELDQTLAADQARLAHCGQRIMEIEEQVNRMRQAAEQAAEARRELEAVERTREFAQQMRTLIRDAGPVVTRAILSRISELATSIYREVMDVPGVDLVWLPSYEIELHSRGQVRSFRLLSGGEQMAAALAVRLALLRQLSKIKFAFLDEPTANMDAERRSLLAMQMPQVKGLKQLFVITHDSAFDNLAAHTLYITKENDVSRITVGEQVAAVGE